MLRILRVRQKGISVWVSGGPICSRSIGRSFGLRHRKEALSDRAEIDRGWGGAAPWISDRADIFGATASGAEQDEIFNLQSNQKLKRKLMEQSDDRHGGRRK